MSQALPYRMYQLQKNINGLDVPFWTCTRRTIYRGRGRGRDGCPALSRRNIGAAFELYWRDLDVNGSYERLRVENTTVLLFGYVQL
jgi:hypothetical protein